jgi:hypothetical protein
MGVAEDNNNKRMRVKWYELLRPGHEYVPKPKSTSDIGESYGFTGMAGLVARTAKSKYFFTQMG